MCVNVCVLCAYACACVAFIDTPFAFEAVRCVFVYVCVCVRVRVCMRVCVYVNVCIKRVCA